MEKLLQRRIEAEARKRLAKYSQLKYYAHKYQVRFEQRTGKPATPPSHALPTMWGHHKHYDPRYCINHSKFIARGLWSSLQSGTYKTVPAARTKIPKAGGGHREIDIFSIPDAALSKIFLDNLRTRNAKIFSSSSYAYQTDKLPLDAILRLRSLLSGSTIFISQYDFSKFFDSIAHDHLGPLLASDGPFLTTHMERCVVQAVMGHEYTDGGKTIEVRKRGIPQGNSMSLFLANVAAHPLDMALERLNGAFTRFADDAVIVNYSYEDALATAEAYHQFSERSGVAINRKKSSGIRILSEYPSELQSLPYFDFLSYRISQAGLSVSERAIDNIKRRCSKIIYNHLLLHPRRAKQIDKARIGSKFYDWDLVTCINELRACIYGGVSQARLDAYLTGSINISNVGGIVSYFCLVEDGRVFQQLDGWLSNVIYRAVIARRNLVKKLLGKTQRKLTAEKLIDGNWYKFSTLSQETRLPSFHTAWRAARKSWGRHGLGGVDAIGMGYGYEV